MAPRRQPQSEDVPVLVGRLVERVENLIKENDEQHTEVLKRFAALEESRPAFTPQQAERLRRFADRSLRRRQRHGRWADLVENHVLYAIIVGPPSALFGALFSAFAASHRWIA